MYVSPADEEVEEEERYRVFPPYKISRDMTLLVVYMCKLFSIGFNLIPSFSGLFSLSQNVDPVTMAKLTTIWLQKVKRSLCASIIC